MLRLAAWGLAALGLALAGCGGDDDDEPAPPIPETRLLEALETIGGAESFTGTGYGWIDVHALAAEGERADELAWAGRALGPGGEDLVRAHEGFRALGAPLADATRLVSLSGSYLFGARVDGIDSSTAERALVAAGARAEPAGEWIDLDRGPPSSRALGTPLESLEAMVARTAVGPDALVLARMDEVRADLRGEGTPSSEAPAARAAAACLGAEVDAVRIVPNNFTHLPNVGPDVMAFGVERVAGEPTWEVLCAIDDSAAEIDDAEAGMRAAFTPGEVDAVTGERISALVDETVIDRLELEGLHVVRARLRLAPTNGPGFLFGAFVRGSLVTYFGLQPPLADAE